MGSVERLGEVRSAKRPTLRLLDVAAMVGTPPDPIPWIVEGFAARGHLTMLSGREGSGKSLLTAAMSAGIAKGEEVAGLTCERGRVLILDSENGESEIHRRVRSLGLPSEGVAIADAYGFSLGQNLRELADLLEATPTDFLILDSFRTLWHRGDENDTRDAAAVLDPLREIVRRSNVAAVLLHHTAKGTGSDYRGSSAIGASVDLGFRLARADGDPEARWRRKIACWKCRIAPEPDQRWVQLHAERGSVYVDRAEPPESDTEASATQPKRRELIPLMLAAAVEPIDWPELAAAIGRDRKDGTARRVRDFLVDSGELRKFPDGRYQGVPNGEGVPNGWHPPQAALESQKEEGCQGAKTLGVHPPVGTPPADPLEAFPTLAEMLDNPAGAELIRASVNGTWEAV